MELKKSSQARGTRVKPRLTNIFETQTLQQGDANELKYLGFDEFGMALTQTVKFVYTSLKLRIHHMPPLMLTICFIASSYLEARQLLKN